MTTNQAQRELWNGESGLRWVASADRRDEVLAPVADELFAAAKLQPGERVLDVGCGCGATTIRAADITGADVWGVDISEPMLNVARARAESRPITFVQADAQTHAFPPEAFDVAISRFGTMFFEDAAAAFANIRAALEPKGRLCIATWQPRDANEWIVVLGDALDPFAATPPVDAGAPGMFAQSEGDVIRGVLADWTQITIEPVDITLHFGATAAEAIDYLADSGPVRSVLDAVTPDRYDEAVAAFRAAVTAHETETGVSLGGAINLIRAQK